MMVPVPKDVPPLPPSVENRLNNLGAPPSDKQGVISDKTTVKNPAIEMQKQIAAEQEKEKAAAATPPALPSMPPLPAPDSKAVQTPITPPSAEKLPPAELPRTPAPTPVPATPIPAAPMANIAPALPKLPGLDAPKAPPSNLPPLSAITGGNAPSSMDILQPKESIESKPLPGTALPLPVAPAAPRMGADDGGPIVKRAIPEVNVGATPDKKLPLPVAPPLPVVKPAAKPVEKLVEKPVVPPAAPVTLPAPTIEAKPLTTNTNPDKLPPAPTALPPMPPALPAPAAKVEAVKPPASPPPVLPPTATPLPAPAAPVTPPKPEPEKTEPPAPAKPAANVPPPPTVVAPPLTSEAAPDTSTTKLTRSLIFDKDKTDLADDAKSDLNDVAEKVKQSQGNVRIVAYASGTPEQASVARRISLSRALQIRAFLISKGVNQLSINVQALGNQVPSGNADRADVFTK